MPVVILPQIDGVLFLCWYQFLCQNQVDFSVGTARKDIAVEMYKKGILELEKGIAVDVSGEGKLVLLGLKYS